MKIGLTGGIGSGKTLVASLFKRLGIAVFEADLEARYLMEHHPGVIHQLKETFGPNIYISQKLKRKQLAAIVFENKNALEQLNQIVHPAVRNQFIQWSENQNSPYVIEEAAILFESGSDKIMDKIIMVEAPEQLRIERTMKRDKVNREQVMARMHNQWPTEKIKPLADFIVLNDDKQLLLPQILKIDSILREIKEQ